MPYDSLRHAVAPNRSSSANTEFLCSLDATYARGEVRADEPGVGSLVGEAAHGHEPHVNSARRQLPIFEVNSIARNDGFVEGKPGLRTIPRDKFIDGVSIASLRLP